MGVAVEGVGNYTQLTLVLLPKTAASDGEGEP